MCQKVLASEDLSPGGLADRSVEHWQRGQRGNGEVTSTGRRETTATATATTKAVSGATPTAKASCNMMGESVADGERGGCGRRSDPVVGGADGGVEAHRDEMPTGERCVLEMQEEGSESREMPR
ncbi:hypothetical protein EZV62_000401 [Acer yangbiense]|uniref:Uncharacterized protein n=1 Tax=Acer yangbiense TaxID=1000413 RepID=A0A5C7ITS5_9ROSI|nr:hypothetical protein EZV62_000401 [Acer yangbiense]